MNRSLVSPAEPPSVASGRRLLALWNQAAFILLTFLLLVLCTWGAYTLQSITGQSRPFTIIYLIPVAMSAALLGVRGGVVSALAALVLARIFLFTHNHPFDISEGVELAALAVGTLTIGVVTGHLRTTLVLLRASNTRLSESNVRMEEANARLVESEQQRRAFNREVLLAVTGGKLQLVEAEELPPPDLAARTPDFAMALQAPIDASALRRELRQIACAMNMSEERIADLCTGVTEAATNAVKHGHGGDARVWTEPDDLVIQITDHGEGISPAHLARATLEQGYSSKVSLGMGFSLILQTTDMLALSTGAQGTSLMLWISTAPRATEQDVLLARYTAF